MTSQTETFSWFKNFLSVITLHLFRNNLQPNTMFVLRYWAFSIYVDANIYVVKVTDHYPNSKRSGRPVASGMVSLWCRKNFISSFLTYFKFLFPSSYQCQVTNSYQFAVFVNFRTSMMTFAPNTPPPFIRFIILIRSRSLRGVTLPVSNTSN